MQHRQRRGFRHGECSELRLLRAATLVTPDPAATAARYAEWFDYVVVERGPVTADLAAAWGAPGSAGRASVVCAPASGAEVYLRFVEGAPVEGYRPLRTYGWAAIEICVRDVLAVAARLERSPFEIIGPPERIEGLPTIYPMQVKGPDGEIVYLTQIDGDLPDHDLPRAGALIDKLFILVLACRDVKLSGAWLERVAGLQQQPPLELVYTVISRAFDMPDDRLHTIATLTHGRDLFLEIDQYPAQASPRPAHPEELAPGVALGTLFHPDLALVTDAWMSSPAPRDGVLYGGRLSGVMRGPDGVLIELLQA